MKAKQNFNFCMFIDLIDVLFVQYNQQRAIYWMIYSLQIIEVDDSNVTRDGREWRAYSYPWSNIMLFEIRFRLVANVYSKLRATTKIIFKGV